MSAGGDDAAMRPLAARTRARRVPFVGDVRMNEWYSGEEVWGETRDLNKGGCYVRTRRTFSQGALLLIEIKSRGARFLTDARVAYTIPSDGMGLSFLNVPASQLPILQGWLFMAERKRTTDAPSGVTE